MAQGRFSAQVRDWVSKTKEQQEAVYKESAQRVIEVMQRPRGAGGNLRIDTGFLRASLVVTTSAGLPVTVEKPSTGKFSWSIGDAALVIAGADIRDPITAVYTANYARHREYGARGQPADRFVALAAQQWGAIVDQVVSEVRG